MIAMTAIALVTSNKEVKVRNLDGENTPFARSDDTEKKIKAIAEAIHAPKICKKLSLIAENDGLSNPNASLAVAVELITSPASLTSSIRAGRTLEISIRPLVRMFILFKTVPVILAMIATSIKAKMDAFTGLTNSSLRMFRGRAQTIKITGRIATRRTRNLPRLSELKNRSSVAA